MTINWKSFMVLGVLISQIAIAGDKEDKASLHSEEWLSDRIKQQTVQYKSPGPLSHNDISWPFHYPISKTRTNLEFPSYATVSLSEDHKFSHITVTKAPQELGYSSTSRTILLTPDTINGAFKKVQTTLESQPESSNDLIPLYQTLRLAHLLVHDSDTDYSADIRGLDSLLLKNNSLSVDIEDSLLIQALAFHAMASSQKDSRVMAIKKLKEFLFNTDYKNTKIFNRWGPYVLQVFTHILNHDLVPVVRATVFQTLLSSDYVKWTHFELFNTLSLLMRQEPLKVPFFDRLNTKSAQSTTNQHTSEVEIPSYMTPNKSANYDVEKAFTRVRESYQLSSRTKQIFTNFPEKIHTKLDSFKIDQQIDNFIIQLSVLDPSELVQKTHQDVSLVEEYYAKYVTTQIARMLIGAVEESFTEEEIDQIKYVHKNNSEIYEIFLQAMALYAMVSVYPDSQKVALKVLRTESINKYPWLGEVFNHIAMNGRDSTVVVQALQAVVGLKLSEEEYNRFVLAPKDEKRLVNYSGVIWEHIPIPHRKMKDDQLSVDYIKKILPTLKSALQSSATDVHQASVVLLNHIFNKNNKEIMYYITYDEAQEIFQLVDMVQKIYRSKKTPPPLWEQTVYDLQNTIKTRLGLVNWCKTLWK